MFQSFFFVVVVVLVEMVAFSFFFYSSPSRIIVYLCRASSFFFFFVTPDEVRLSGVDVVRMAAPTPFYLQFTQKKKKKKKTGKRTLLSLLGGVGASAWTKNEPVSAAADGERQHGSDEFTCTRRERKGKKKRTGETRSTYARTE